MTELWNSGFVPLVLELIAPWEDEDIKRRLNPVHSDLVLRWRHGNEDSVWIEVCIPFPPSFVYEDSNRSI